ncbi:ATP-binding protein [Leptolyngbya sp. AN02str]
MKQSWVLRYGVAVFFSFAALALTQMLWPYMEPALYPFFLASVMLSSWLAGFGPGLVSTLFGALLSEYFFLPPQESFAISLENGSRISYFAGVAILICTLNARIRYAQRYAEISAAEAQHNQDLLLQNQKNLQQSEERFRLLVEGVTDYAIFILDPEGCILSWTIGAERILGYQETEILGQPFSILFTEEAIQQERPRQVLDLAKTQGFCKENRWQIRKDKTQFWAHCVISVLQDEAGNLAGFSKIMQDITARKKAEEERSQLLKREQLARQEAESANQAKDEFLAFLSHELRTPLTAITGWVGLLRSGKLDDVRTKIALETIERNATLQMQLIEDLLDISRIIKGDLWLDSQPVSLVDIIQEAIEVIRPKIEEKQIHFLFEISSIDGELLNDRNRQTDPISLVVLGDAERLQQVVLNLLSNAIKFTPNNGKITVSLSVVNRLSEIQSPSKLDKINSIAVHSPNYEVQLQVKDTGIGIEAEFLPHVFDRFRQSDSTNTRSYKGLGLGLAIARYLVERQAGRIWAESLGKGQGATITVKLPLLQPIQNNCDRHSLQADTTTKFSLKGLSILVVDDEADTRIWLKNILEMHQASVIAVGSANDAITKLTSVVPDVVVSDIAMPEKDGYTLMNALKHHEQQSGQVIPAIALTAHASVDDVKKSLAAGFRQHLTKPIKGEDLITAIASYCSSRILREGIQHENSGS